MAAKGWVTQPISGWLHCGPTFRSARSRPPCSSPSRSPAGSIAAALASRAWSCFHCVTQPISGWLHCGRAALRNRHLTVPVTQPISGWLHCGAPRAAGVDPSPFGHPADLRLAPLRRVPPGRRDDVPARRHPADLRLAPLRFPCCEGRGHHDGGSPSRSPAGSIAARRGRPPPPRTRRVTQPISGWLHCGGVIGLDQRMPVYVTQPISGWLHCGWAPGKPSAQPLQVTQPISGWLHCGGLNCRAAVASPAGHPADLRLAPLRRIRELLSRLWVPVTQPISGWLHCGFPSREGIGQGVDVTQPISGWLHCGERIYPGDETDLEVTQPISGWLHCGPFPRGRRTPQRPRHPADLRLAPLRRRRGERRVGAAVGSPSRSPAGSIAARRSRRRSWPP